MKLKGIHHISSIVWHAQENLDFYAGVLGLKLVKKTLNFDDARIYHTTFGNHNASNGTLMTFFPWKKNFKEGLIGDGQVAVTTFVIPFGSLDFWMNRLDSFKKNFNKIQRFNQTYLAFKDPHGINIELLEENFHLENNHEFNGVTKDYSIKGIIGATLFSKDYVATKEFFINILGMTIKEENNYYIRFNVDSELNQFVDLYKAQTFEGKMGAGTTHHIAFGVKNEDMTYFIETLKANGYDKLELKNRKYFEALYFREPGGILIELSTLLPGMMHDEDEDSLGKHMLIPPHFVNQAEDIIKDLMPLEVQEITELVTYPYEDMEGYKSYIYHKNLLARINYLAKEAKVRQLTEDELEERQNLRQIYVKLITGQIKQNLENVMIEDKTGEYKKLEKK